MTINQERFPTYKPLSPVLRTQPTYGFKLFGERCFNGFMDVR